MATDTLDDKRNGLKLHDACSNEVGDTLGPALDALDVVVADLAQLICDYRDSAYQFHMDESHGLMTAIRQAHAAHRQMQQLHTSLTEIKYYAVKDGLRQAPVA